MAIGKLKLDELPGDVLYRIVEALLELRSDFDSFTRKSLKQLSCTSRRIRFHCMPFLFYHCRGIPSDEYLSPPQSIRPYVRSVSYTTSQNIVIVFTSDHPNGTIEPPAQDFGLDLGYFPNVSSVQFHYVPGGVPWRIIMRCLSHPNVTSLSIAPESAWTSTTPPNPSDLSRHPCRLTEFSYTPWQWREVERRAKEKDMRSSYALESAYLHALVLAMPDTAESLTLPVETAPLVEMAAREWPRLRSLSLVGESMHPDQCRAIPPLLVRMPNLRSLSVEVAQRRGMERPSLLSSPRNSLQLRSLTISYPNPRDPIFSCLGAGLVSLSLRDSPRHCFRERYGLYLPLTVFPILTSTECLTILQRILGPQLSTLELVYQADAAEDELLRHLAHAFPRLQELELHRYKAFPEEDVPYLHLARLLTSVKLLRALYLNLDIEKSLSPPWCTDTEDLKMYDKARVARGKELLAILKAGAHFEYVALFLHTAYVCDWMLFHPEWSPNPPVDVNSRFSLDCYTYVPTDPMRYR